MFDFHNNPSHITVLDYWIDYNTKLAYCIYINTKEKETNKKSNYYLAETKYEDK